MANLLNINSEIISVSDVEINLKLKSSDKSSTNIIDEKIVDGKLETPDKSKIKVVDGEVETPDNSNTNMVEEEVDLNKMVEDAELKYEGKVSQIRENFIRDMVYDSPELNQIIPKTIKGEDFQKIKQYVLDSAFSRDNLNKAQGLSSIQIDDSLKRIDSLHHNTSSANYKRQMLRTFIDVVCVSLLVIPCAYLALTYSAFITV